MSAGTRPETGPDAPPRPEPAPGGTSARPDPAAGATAAPGDVLLDNGWLYSNDGRREGYIGPSWAECTDAEVDAVRAMERAGWSTPYVPDGYFGPMTLARRSRR